MLHTALKNISHNVTKTSLPQGNLITKIQEGGKGIRKFSPYGLTLPYIKENETILIEDPRSQAGMRGNMDSSYELIDSYWDVQDNVQQFNYDLKFDAELCSRLNQFRSWYYVPELDQFGPSQFVGYKWMSAAEYKEGNLNGEATERALWKFFRPVPRSDPLRGELEDKLFDLCSRYGKRPNKAHRINIPIDWFE